MLLLLLPELIAGLHEFVVAIPGHIGFVLGVVLREPNLVVVHCAMGLSVVCAHRNQHLEHFTGCNHQHTPCCCQRPWCCPHPLLLP